MEPMAMQSFIRLKPIYPKATSEESVIMQKNAKTKYQIECYKFLREQSCFFYNCWHTGGVTHIIIRLSELDDF